VGTVGTLAKEAGLPLVWYAHPATLGAMRELPALSKALPNVLYNAFDDWDDFLIFSKDVKPNDLFLIVSSRPGHASYLSQLGRLPYYLARYFTVNSFLLLFPHQLPSPLSPVSDTAVPAESGRVRGYFRGLFSRRG
jgi:hypothetical protein